MSGASPFLTTVIHSNKLITFCFFSKTAIYNIFFIRWTDIIIDFFCSRTSFKRFQLILKLFYSFWIVKFCIAKDSVSASLSPVNSIYDTHLTFFNLPKNLFAASFWVKFVSSPTTCSSNDQDIPRKITFWDHLFIHALAVDLSQNFNSFYVTFKIYSWSISSCTFMFFIDWSVFKFLKISSPVCGNWTNIYIIDIFNLVQSYLLFNMFISYFKLMPKFIKKIESF